MAPSKFNQKSRNTVSEVSFALESNLGNEFEKKLKVLWLSNKYTKADFLKVSFNWSLVLRIKGKIEERESTSEETYKCFR